MTVCMVISLPKIPYIYTVYTYKCMVLANPTEVPYLLHSCTTHTQGTLQGSILSEGVALRTRILGMPYGEGKQEEEEFMQTVERSFSTSNTEIKYKTEALGMVTVWN